MYYIRELRQTTGLSQKEFSDMFHIPVSTLRKWEQNQSSPPSYVVRLIKNYLPASNKEYEIYFGSDGKKYYLDRQNNRVGDSLGNWIHFNESIDGVIQENISIYIEEFFAKYYEAIRRFDEDLKIDKMHHIRWK